MERKKFNESLCSIARPLDILGDWWNPLILRECLYGITRFEGMQQWLGISRNILTRRLTQLVEEGLLEKQAYQQKPERYEYQLTEKGYEACIPILAMMPFGNRWCFQPKQHPIELRDKKTGKRINPVLVDADTGKPIDPREISAAPGPGFKAPDAIIQERFREYFEWQNKQNSKD